LADFKESYDEDNRFKEKILSEVIDPARYMQAVDNTVDELL